MNGADLQWIHPNFTELNGHDLTLRERAERNERALKRNEMTSSELGEG